MKQGLSSRKVNGAALEVIADILLYEIADPRLSLVSVTGCEVSYDRSVCNVFYATAPDNYQDAQAAFDKAAGRIRSLMAQKLSWRVVPKLRFMLDTSVDEAQRIASALQCDAAHFAGISREAPETSQAPEVVQVSEASQMPQAPEVAGVAQAPEAAEVAGVAQAPEDLPAREAPERDCREDM